MRKYKFLQKQAFELGSYSIVPLRHEDRIKIMDWRNEQIYHLRQSQPLTKQAQDHYFNTVVASLFEEDQPKQILFSYLENNKCIGYGGLVHIDWVNKNAEISFIMETALEKEYFEMHWHIFLELIEKVAFEELGFRKIFLFIYNIRPHLYKIVLKVKYEQEAVLKDHYFWKEQFIDAKIFSKFNS
jgi:hypothetical protein